ncbi:MAG: hydrogenase maturation protease [Rhodospirillales bacterium]
MDDDAPEPILVIGVGNPDRGDDGAGPRVAALLGTRGVDAIAHRGDGLALIGLWTGRSRVVIVDAVAAGGPPGRVRRFDATERPLPRQAFAVSSHAIGLAEAVETARALQRLPGRLLVYGIEAGSFAPGAGLSAPVERACERLARRILTEADRGGVLRPPDAAPRRRRGAAPRRGSQ